MKRLRYLIVAICIISSMSGVTRATERAVAKPIPEVTDENDQLDNKDEEEKIELLTKKDLLKSVKDSPVHDRYERLLGEEVLVSEEVLGKILCYTYGLSPIYDKELKTSPFIYRLKKEGLWPLETKERMLTKDEWQILYEKQLLPYINREEKKRQIQKNDYFEAIPLDYLKLSTMKVVVDGTSYPLYQLGNTNYISFSTLEQLGFDIYSTEKEMVAKNPYSLLASDHYQEKSIDKEKVALTPLPIKLGNLQTYGIGRSDETYIPVRAMSEYFQIDIVDGQCILTSNSTHTYQYVKIEDNTLTNIGEVAVTVGITHYFWNGKQIEESALVVEALRPNESYALHEEIYLENKKVIHYSTVIHDMKLLVSEEVEETIVQNHPMSYGQNNKDLFESYEKSKVYQKEGYLENLFPKTSIIGTMKYDTKGLKKGESIQVWGAEAGRSYYVIKDGKKITIPWGSIKIPPNPKVQKEWAKKEDIEGFVNKQNIQSRTKYLVWTDLYRQLTYVFEKQSNKWVLIRTMLCTTGNNITPTPPDEYELLAYVPYFGVEKGYRCKNAIQIRGDYLYHSVMFDKKGNYVLGGQVLGEQGSHGCIRLSPEDSEWFYHTMPLKTKVIIR